MKRCNWRHTASILLKRQGTVAIALIAAIIGTPTHTLRADVVGIGDVSPSIVEDGEDVADLPQFGGPVPGGELIVGGTGSTYGGTASGQLTIDIPSDTDPLTATTGIIGGTEQGLGYVRVVSLNSQLLFTDTLTIGEFGQGYLEIVDGARVGTNGQGSSGDYDFQMGLNDGSQGFAVVDGLSSLLLHANAGIGIESFGAIEVINSSRMQSIESAVLGDTSLGSGSVLVDGLGSRWSVGLVSAGALGSLTLGNEGRGVLTIQNQGRTQVLFDTELGAAAGGYGEITVTGRNSLMQSSVLMVIGNAAGTGMGVVNVEDNGLARADFSATVNPQGFINLDGGTFLTPLLTNNDGVIRGSGVVNATVVANNGDIRNAAGVANTRERLLFTGAVTNSVGSVIESQGGEMEFQKIVVNNGQIFGRDAIFRFRAGVSGTGGEMFIGNSTIESPIPLTVASLTVEDSGSSSVIGDLTLTGNLNMEIGYSFSKLFVTGDANLGGALNITLESGFTPYIGQSWEIITAGDINGDFASVNAPALPGVTWGVQKTATSAILTTLFVPPPAGSGADFNGDNIVDAQDLAIWQGNFGLGANPPPAATQADGDANGDGVVDGSDFMLIQQQFGGPPPATPAFAAVPEPGSALLVLAAIGLPFAARRRRT